MNIKEVLISVAIVVSVALVVNEVIVVLLQTFQLWQFCCIECENSCSKTSLAIVLILASVANVICPHNNFPS